MGIMINGQHAFRLYRGFHAGPGQVAGLFIDCPGCGRAINVHFRQDLPPCWEWDGDVEAPTIIPAISCVACEKTFEIYEGEIRQ